MSIEIRVVPNYLVVTNYISPTSVDFDGATGTKILETHVFLEDNKFGSLLRHICHPVPEKKGLWAEMHRNIQAKFWDIPQCRHTPHNAEANKQPKTQCTPITSSPPAFCYFSGGCVLDGLAYFACWTLGMCSMFCITPKGSNRDRHNLTSIFK